MPDLNGRTFADLEIIAKVGEGGMGAVYKARQPVLNRFVALKIVAPSQAANANFIERFKHEAAAAAQFNHPNIVQVHTAGEFNGTHYIVMEFVEGESLDQRLAREGRMDPQEALAICVYVAQALDYAWQKAKLIHRDIKPSNIFLSKEGAVKVGDLGLAKSVAAEAKGAGLTQSGTTVGTPYYCSPEQARAEKDMDFRSDLYSLGCTLYRMLSGKAPYEADGEQSPMSVMVKHITEPPPAILTLLPTCPGPLVILLSKMLAKQPSARHQSYAELIADLIRVHDQLARPKPSTPFSSSLQAATVRKKPPVLIYGAAAVAAAVVAGLLLWAPWKTDGNASVRPAEPPEQAQEQQKKPETPTAAAKTSVPSASPSPTAGGTPALPNAVAVAKPSSIDDAFIKEVAALPAEEQVKRVMAKLKELNPGFDGKETHKIEDGKVTDLTFSSVGVTNISPVRALSGLRHLFIQATREKPSLIEDLSPLRCLRLTDLNCSFTRVADLSALKDMPLVVLACEGTRVSDLSPLKGMVRLKNLSSSATQVEDLSPLKGMALNILTLGETKVSDLTPLKGMPLTYFVLYHTTVSDLTPITGMPLTHLSCSDTKVTDLSPIRGMKLATFHCDFKPERDAALLRSIKTLETINKLPAAEFWKKVDAELVAKPATNVVTAAMPAANTVASVAATVPQSSEDAFFKSIAGLPADQKVARVVAKLKELNPNFDGKETHKIESGAVTELSISTVGVTDITPVRALKWLKKLVVTPWAANQKGALSDLSALKGLPLTWLWCHNNPINDLSPLKGMPLTVLSCGGTQVGDLSPLTGMKLTVLSFNDTTVTELGPLEGMPLTVLWCNNTQVTDLSPLQTMPLQELRCNFSPDRDAAILRGIKTLAKINDVAAGAFWMRIGPIKGASVSRQPSAGATTSRTTTPAPGQATGSAKLTPTVGHAQPNQPYVTGISLELVWIPPGEFMLGSTKEEREWAALPRNGGGGNLSKWETGEPKKATIKNGFWLGRTEVTVGQWRQFANTANYQTDAENVGEANGPRSAGDRQSILTTEKVKGLCWTNTNFGIVLKENHPVSYISWNDAVAFCEWLTTEEQKVGRLPAGYKIRLPTEAEWEYACRAGKQTKFWWGDTEVGRESRQNGAGDADPFPWVSPVDYFGARGRNRFGLADMLGNVDEWCMDGFDPAGPHEQIYTADNSSHPVRGGSSVGSHGSVRCGYRAPDGAATARCYHGFRVSCGVEPSSATGGRAERPITTSAGQKTMPATTTPTGAISAKEQIRRFVEKMKELNPEFDGKVDYKADARKVTELEFSAMGVTDISPIAQFKDLAKLKCEGVGTSQRSKLADLSPLKGMQLTELLCGFSQVDDLSPLKGMRLTSLSIMWARVADLSPLNGMSLKYLTMNGVQVNDLSPLKGMPLTSMSFNDTPISDLSPLKGMPLTRLSLAKTKVTDLSPLKNMRLNLLRCYKNQVTDLSPIKGMPLEELACDFVSDRDAKILRSIKTLVQINNLPAKEFWKRVEAGEAPQATK
ncbi:MAG: SUMF1/EgtB/PvdO family nonheme iron enzyme [Verrucomicrobiia bacterium]|jgi:serine/threonine protein kinase/formylglycine-generating enzyme required for sulfatase activity